MDKLCKRNSPSFVSYPLRQIPGPFVHLYISTLPDLRLEREMGPLSNIDHWSAYSKPRESLIDELNQQYDPGFFGKVLSNQHNASPPTKNYLTQPEISAPLICDQEKTVRTGRKTSMYRGVSRTGSSTWGAVFNSQPLSSIDFKTEEEAARFYDAYLMQNIPESYAKNANFCPTCDQFTNSLGLPWVESKCACFNIPIATPQSPVSTVTSSSPQLISPEESDASLEAEFDQEIQPYQWSPTQIAPVEPTYPAASRHSLELGVTAEPYPIDMSQIMMVSEQNAAFGGRCSSFEQIFRDVEASTRGGMQQPSTLPDGAEMQIRTHFLSKYWRNDRKNIQCFPYCPEFGDYHQMKLANKTHSARGVCRAGVTVELRLRTTDQQHVIVFAKCTAQEAAPDFTGKNYSKAEIESLYGSWVTGASKGVSDPDVEGFSTIVVEFHPDVWKYDAELPKKRRQNDPLHAELEYVFQVEAFHSHDGENFSNITTSKSTPFEIASTRTLSRQKSRMNESSTPGLNDACPEKKKVKIRYGQQAYDHTKSTIVLSPEDLPVFENDQKQRGDVKVESKPDVHIQIQTPQVNARGMATTERIPSSSYRIPNVFSGKLLGFTLVNLLTSLLVGPFFSIALVLSVFIPFAFAPLVDASEKLADLDLCRANTNGSDPYQQLERIDPGQTQGLSRSWLYMKTEYVWQRMLYFSFGKILVAIPSLFGFVFFSLFGVILFPVRGFFFEIANGCAHFSILYSKTVLGKARL